MNKDKMKGRMNAKSSQKINQSISYITTANPFNNKKVKEEILRFVDRIRIALRAAFVGHGNPNKSIPHAKNLTVLSEERLSCCTVENRRLERTKSFCVGIYGMQHIIMDATEEVLH
ncbi:hypothetical protein RF11_14930 [Thelohanellus kitauei]|uniref:Uncharacterized protein n=1 Tax=Thelohanellus kitauei TaxID=669202 RepID=A0A0C2J7H9_THEKT|nr:hypothetical protein RF11_14930 [Thelohanellus kitauei]